MNNLFANNSPKNSPIYSAKIFNYFSEISDVDEMLDSKILEEELGLSSDFSETDGIRFKTVHFERKRSSSSS